MSSPYSEASPSGGCISVSCDALVAATALTSLHVVVGVCELGNAAGVLPQRALAKILEQSGLAGDLVADVGGGCGVNRVESLTGLLV